MINIQNALKIDGWMQPAELEWLGNQASKSKIVIEVGSWMGRSTRAIADNLPEGGIVYAVDTWNGSDEPRHKALLADKPEDWLFNQFAANIGKALLCRETTVMENGIEYPHQIYTVRPYRNTSLAGADYLGKGCYNVKADMIFLDAAHDYENVEADITAWLPNIAPGGVMCGHDFGGPFAGVTRAVMSAFPKAHKVGAGSIWIAE